MRTRRPDQAGAVLIFALLILVVGATILGGIAQLAVTQSLAGRAEWDAAARRIRLENSRAMARQYIMSQMWRDFGQLPQASVGTNAAGGLGGFSITNVEPQYGFWLSLQQDGSDRINPFNLFERGGFQSAWAAGSLSTGSGDVAWGFQVRTRSPITAGFAFVNQRPAANNWVPTRRINMQQTNYAVGFTNLPRMPVSSVTNTSAGDTNGFLGFLSAPKAEAPFGDFYGSTAGLATNFFTSGAGATLVTNAQIVVDLGTYSYYNLDGCLFYEVPARVDRPELGSYTNAVTSLVLQGGADSTPVQISVPEANNTLTNIVLSGDNLRPVYLYHRGSSSLVISTTATTTSFRIGMTLFSSANLAPSGALTIVGGVRTSQPLANSQGTVTLQSEASANWRYDAIADRMMWLEDQRIR
jgi:hypothetical protein